MTLDVLIIGAGLSGLAVARTLRAHGMTNMRLVEKSRGPGGRLASKRLEGARADIGAQFMTARDPRFRAVLEDAMAAQAVAVWSPRMGKLTAQGLVFSPDTELRYLGAPYMNAFARFLADDLDIDTQQRVESVSNIGDGWQVVTSTTAWTARHVVITAPLEQLRDLLPDPTLHTMVHGFQSLPTWTVVVHSTSQLLTDDGQPLDAAFGDGQWFDFISREGSRPQRNSSYWVCHSAPAFSQRHLEDSPEVVGQRLCQALEDQLNFAATPVLAHRWRFARPANPERTAQKGAVRLAPGLWACGDGLAGGRCEGAYLSGLEVADRILAGL